MLSSTRPSESFAVSSRVPPVLVGREEELDTVTELVLSPPAVLLLEGEAGVGKTRLIRESLERPEIERTILTGACQPLQDPFPYGPVIDALRTLDPFPDPAHLNPVTGALRRLLPELGEFLPPTPELLGDTAAERHQLFRGVHALLEASTPAILVVEDLHWADEGTRELLRFLITDPPGELALVLSYRREELAGGVPLGTAYRHPRRACSAVMTLRPLNIEQVGTLAAHLLGTESVEAGFARELHERTAGLPFVVAETLPTLRAQRERRPYSAGELKTLEQLDVPVLLRDAMAERLGALPEPVTRLVHAAAVLGIPAEAGLLGRIAGVPDAAHRIAWALRANVLHEDGNLRYGFRHCLARQAVQDTLTGPERRELHERALRLLSEQERPPLIRLAEHSMGCGRVADWLHYGTAAADRAIETGDIATATELLCSLLEEPSLSTDDVDRLAVRFGQAALDGLGQHPVPAALRRVLSDQRLSATARGEVRLSLGLLLLRQSDRPATARSELELAVAELRELPERAAVGMAALAQAHVGTTPYERCSEWTDRAEIVLDETDSTAVRSELLANVLPSRMFGGGCSAAWRHFERLPPAGGAGPERHHIARIHGNVADAYTWLGEYSAAREHLTEALGLARAAGGSPYLDSTLRSTDIRLRRMTGAWEELVGNAERLLRDHGQLRPVAVELALVLGMDAVTRGDWEAAERWLTATGVDTPDDSFTPVVIAAGATRVRLRLLRGDPPGAVNAADHAVRVVRRKGIWIWANELLPNAVAAYARLDRGTEAEQLIDEFTAATANRRSPLIAPATAAARAFHCESAGRFAGAAEWWETARAGYAALPQPYSAALARERVVAHQLRSGDDSAATRMSEVIDSFERLGASRDAARCRQLLRDSGVPPPSSRRGRRGYGAELSPRERDVARLVGLGNTNREIAALLFLSPRTVEQHVAKVIRKLGVTSRTEVRTE
ncbi:regulatory protein, luxR family [Actinopolyspora lacussalsi subsp. righensis]|uniref:Regulatory protein, luxR family n=1 Tax=Actinopolyspora righensis TaxID=995060 RepID=A0A1I6Y6X5_9ACTN|nr:LuxR family transcriptional regulator [Actinopolyspora righensis]SFT46315.1 regulatory protein, luxR family [Actinopolyspora righensis]